MTKLNEVLSILLMLSAGFMFAMGAWARIVDENTAEATYYLVAAAVNLLAAKL